MNKARRYANLMPAVIAKSCNKLLIGKTYWKSAALPAISQRTFFEDMSTLFLHDILRALQILLTVRLSGYV